MTLGLLQLLGELLAAIAPLGLVAVLAALGARGRADARTDRANLEVKDAQARIAANPGDPLERLRRGTF